MQKEHQIQQYPTPSPKIARQISELSGNQHYALIYPAQNVLQGKYKTLFGENMKPYLLVFQDQDNLTQKELAIQYLQENNIKLKPQYIYFHQLRTDYPFRNMKLSELKRIFQKQTIDGFCFQLTIFQSDIELETGLIDMVGFQKKVPLKDKTLVLYFQQINLYFNVNLQTNDTFKVFCERISRELKKELNVIVKHDKFSLSFIDESLKQTIVTSKNFRCLKSTDYLFFKFLEPIKMSKPVYKNQNSYIIIHNSLSLQQKKFAYKQVRNIKVHTIMEKFLEFGKKGEKSNNYGLRIHDLIVKPCESLSDFPILDQLFFTQSKYVKIVKAIIVKESFMFYSHLQKMGQIIGPNKVYFTKILYNSKKNQDHRRNCTEAIKNRAINAKNIAFKNNQQRIEPILYYTSELQVKQNRSDKSIKLYDAQNGFLRKMNFGNIKRHEYNRWQFWFAHTLLNNLKFIQEYKGDLYRGVSHSETYKIGKIIQFRQFSSCSNDRKVALGFASSALYILKNCKVARKISEYSFFQKEYEVLNLPYSYYKITKIEKQTNLFQEISVVTLQQVSSPEIRFDMKDQKQLFILWVDGDKGEGVQFSKNVNQVAQTTFFVHMKSTKELQTWFNLNKQKLKDPTISIALITNMFRVENGVQTENAGALAIKTFKSNYAKGNILVYIGDIQKAKKTLAANQVAIGGNVQITNNQYGLLTFFADCCGVS